VIKRFLIVATTNSKSCERHINLRLRLGSLTDSVGFSDFYDVGDDLCGNPVFVSLHFRNPKKSTDKKSSFSTAFKCLLSSSKTHLWALSHPTNHN
jgi:hypothetical protein